MKKAIVFTALLVLLTGSIGVIRQANKANLDVHLKQVQLQSNAKKLDKLNHQKANSDAQVKQLNAEKQKLEQQNKQLQKQLQAKAIIKHDKAIAYAASLDSLDPTQQVIVRAAEKYNIDPVKFLRLARCESTFNPNAVNSQVIDGGHASGLFQQVTTYWPDRAARYGWPGASVFNQQANAEVTAQMIRDGQSGLWECKYE